MADVPEPGREMTDQQALDAITVDLEENVRHVLPDDAYKKLMDGLNAASEHVQPKDWLEIVHQMNVIFGRLRP